MSDQREGGVNQHPLLVTSGQGRVTQTRCSPSLSDHSCSAPTYMTRDHMKHTPCLLWPFALWEQSFVVLCAIFVFSAGVGVPCLLRYRFTNTADLPSRKIVCLRCGCRNPKKAIDCVDTFLSMWSSILQCLNISIMTTLQYCNNDNSCPRTCPKSISLYQED